VVLTRRGRPAAVIVSPEELESLEETLEVLSNERALAEIREAQAQIRSGQVVTGDELRAKYLER
jgi:PHD/YefM family antitoxin component YafN of YafNO toxin-antitoxin module